MSTDIVSRTPEGGQKERRVTPLRAGLAEFADYYNRDRPHRRLGLESPLPSSVRARGRLVSRPVLGGLHHVYARAA